MYSFKKLKNSKEYAKTKIVPIFKNAGYEKIAGDIQYCGTLMRFATCKDCDEKHFTSFIRCKNKFCPNCAKLKSLIQTARIMPIVQAWLEKGNYIFIANFTIENQTSLAKGLDIVAKAWRHMTADNKEYRKEWKETFCGGIRSLEIKLGKGSGIWHPHLHTLIFKDKFSRDYAFLKSHWVKSCKVAGLEMKDGEKLASVYTKGFQKSSTQKEILKAVLETVKYITKFGLMEEEQTIELVENTKGLRQFSTWGVLRGIQKQVEKDLETEDSAKLQEFICESCGCTAYELEQLYEYQLERDDYKTVKSPYRHKHPTKSIIAN